MLCVCFEFLVGITHVGLPTGSDSEPRGWRCLRLSFLFVGVLKHVAGTKSASSRTSQVACCKLASWRNKIRQQFDRPASAELNFATCR